MHLSSLAFGLFAVLTAGAANAASTPLICETSLSKNEFADYRVYGSFSPASVSQVASKREGHVLEWHVEVGDSVSKNDPLLSLETTHEPYALEYAKQARRLAERQLSSSQQLVAANHVSAIEIEELKTTLAQRIMEENDAITNAQHRVLKAPFNGLIENRLVNVGEYVSTGQEALRLVESDRHLLSAEVYQAPSRCANTEDCVLYFDEGSELQGPYEIDFMVPLTALNQGMFRIGSYLHGERTSGIPATLYLIPKTACKGS